ncbi:MAG: magnesium/cobalt transporter CorA [Tissierellales bacterium]|nr:magnesium/cobalt transporter CorA [Tissierellales bacterium]
MKKIDYNYPPGTLIYTGEYKNQKSIIQLMAYDLEHVFEEYIINFNRPINMQKIEWVNIVGFNDLDIIIEAGKKFDINNLILEDVLNVQHRSKIEIEEESVFAILKMVYIKNDIIVHEHISIIMKNNYLITFQETQGDVFDSLRERIRTGKGNIRKLGIDYLFYSILDAIVDHYYSALSLVEDNIDEIEQLVMTGDQTVLERIHSLKKELIFLRSSILPIKDIIRNLIEELDGFVNSKNREYYKDLNDHLTEISDKLTTYRELANSLNETHASNVNNNMNKVITILTMFSALFIPLTFMTGFFGMNFKFFPGIDYKYGVHVFIISCLMLSGVMLFFIKRKRWF